ncbi:MAG: hypothetical protein AMXMBFR36_08440 [Acidobacteriota bacterium]
MRKRGPTPPPFDTRKVGGEVVAAGAAVAGAGGALMATAATACCAGPVIAPLVLGILGAGGAAWAARFEPYSVWFLAGSGGMLAFGFWSIYRVRLACEVPAGGRNARQRLVRLLLWVSASLWVAAVAINVWVLP